ncbi:hypothetical protein ACOMHN_062937 [Nucella lapillus]
MTEPDLSLLPEMVLVHLFKVLPVCARGSLATCCWTLRDVMARKSVWSDVTLELDTRPRQGPPLTDSDQVVGSLRARDRVLIHKHGQHLKNVHVVTGSPHIDQASVDVLTALCERGVVKTLSLRWDRYLGRLIELGGDPRVETPVIKNLLVDNLFSGGRRDPARQPPSLARLLQRLRPGTTVSVSLCPDTHHGTGPPFSVSLCPHTHGTGPPFSVPQCLPQAQLRFTWDRYREPESEECHSRLKRLEMTTYTGTETGLAWGNGRLSFRPTAQLVARFPALQELSVSVGNVSEQLLQALSAPGRTAPLRRLALRHEDGDLRPCPRLSSAAWSRLVKASPSLSVAYCVVTHRLPLLCDVLKPETPLARLAVSCLKSFRGHLLELYRMCRQHGSTLEVLHLSLAPCPRLKDDAMLDSFEDMAKTCPRLRHLCCAIEIRQQLLLHLARDSRRWTTFRFSPQRILASQQEDRSSGPGLSARQKQFMCERRLIGDQCGDTLQSDVTSVECKDYMGLVLLLRED